MTVYIWTIKESFLIISFKYSLRNQDDGGDVEGKNIDMLKTTSKIDHQVVQSLR